MENKPPDTFPGNQLHANRFFKIAEILVLFILGFGLIKILTPLAGDNPLFRQVGVGVVNIVLLVYIWFGLKLRGGGWKDFGLKIRSVTWREGIKGFLLSIVVAFLGAAGFILGSIIMANVTGIPESADMSGYNYLNDNLGMLLLVLGGVYIFSSFGEEVIYRAFLINRISEFGQGTKKATILAVILSSVIFGLIHYEWGPMGMVQTGLMGLVMGICYIKLNKRLWILILAHAYLDTILLVQLYLAG